MNLYSARFAFLLFLALAAAHAGAPQGAVAAEIPPGTIFKDCEGCPEMVALPKGVFVMGDKAGRETQKPAHLVQIKKPFAMGRYEVTFDEWRLCVADGGCTVKPSDHKWGRGARPVMNITWEEAVGYTKWLSRRTGKSFRLPTEAEWEYAARAGTQTRFSWGDEATGKALGNCRDCGAEISHKTEPVGSFPPNPWGLYDMNGNVWEWLADCWVPTYEGAPNDGSARQMPNDAPCTERSMRSGSWYYFSKNMATTWRAKNDARVRGYGIGFRLARDLD